MSGGKFSQKQLKAIETLAGGVTVTETARLLGVCERTVYRWKDTPGFSDAVRRFHGEKVELVGIRLLNLAETAVDALQDVLEHPTQEGANQKRLVSVAVLSLVLNWRITTDYEERLIKLEGKEN